MSRYLATTLSRKLEMWKHKRERRQRIKREKLVRARESAEAWQKKRAEVYARDRGRCRATGVKLLLHGPDPFTVAHIHHIVYRSAGGKDETWNLCVLDPTWHDLEHAGRLDIEGNADATLSFTERDTKGNIVRVWESECPR
jgi:hypothetical protein